MQATLTPGFYECPVKNSQPRLVMITDEGETWIGAKRIPDHLLRLVWPHCKPIDMFKDNARMLELIGNK